MFTTNDKYNLYRWSKIERLILLVTLLCTVTITFYSIKTSNAAIAQSRINLRPWVSLPQVHTVFHSDNIEIRQTVENIGNIPCFIKTVGEITYLIGNKQESKKPDNNNILVLLPGQYISVGFTISGELKEKVVEKRTGLNISIATTVYYSESKSNIEKYHTYSKSNLLMKNIPQKITKGEPVEKTEGNIWKSVESSFK